MVKTSSANHRVMNSCPCRQTTHQNPLPLQNPHLSFMKLKMQYVSSAMGSHQGWTIYQQSWLNPPAYLVKKAIHRLCVNIWETFEWPHEWKQQEFVVLHKSGDKKECSNYRTIALISHISKILLYIILKRLKQKLEFEISEEQAVHSYFFIRTIL